MRFHYTCALFCRTRFKHTSMASKGIENHCVFDTFGAYDGVMLSKSLIFHYTCALFRRTKFQHACLIAKSLIFNWF